MINNHPIFFGVNPPNSVIPVTCLCYVGTSPDTRERFVVSVVGAEAAASLWSGLGSPVFGGFVMHIL